MSIRQVRCAAATCGSVGSRMLAVSVILSLLAACALADEKAAALTGGQAGETPTSRLFAYPAVGNTDRRASLSAVERCSCRWSWFAAPYEMGWQLGGRYVRRWPSSVRRSWSWIAHELKVSTDDLGEVWSRSADRLWRRPGGAGTGRIGRRFGALELSLLQAMPRRAGDAYSCSSIAAWGRRPRTGTSTRRAESRLEPGAQSVPGDCRLSANAARRVVPSFSGMIGAPGANSLRGSCWPRWVVRPAARCRTGPRPRHVSSRARCSTTRPRSTRR